MEDIYGEDAVEGADCEENAGSEEVPDKIIENRKSLFSMII